MLLRISLAIAFGLVLGLDRNKKNKPIDFRAYMIICVMTCILALLSQQMYYDLKDSDEFISLDLGKIIAGVLTGIGFLGAGAIIKRDNDQVVGTATGASVWASGIIGLSLGFGAYPLAIIGFISVASILIIGGIFVPHINNNPDKQINSTKDN